MKGMYDLLLRKHHTRIVMDNQQDELKKVASEKNEKAWLITWNPKNWDWENYDDVVASTQAGNIEEDTWSCLNSHVVPGDRVFLLVVGKGKQNGIIASGHVTSSSFEMDHWDFQKYGQKARGITVAFDCILDYTKQEILKQDYLKERFPLQVWSPQGSGISIKPQYVSQLEEEWEQIKRKNKPMSVVINTPSEEEVAGIREAILRYKENISEFWKEENYKWFAVKHFQDTWDIEAQNFAEMLEEAFAYAYNLLSGGNYYPYKMICTFARYYQEKVRGLFRSLYDRRIPFSERIGMFRKECATMLEQLREQIPGYEKAINYYQDLRAICVYLSFMYPDEYFLYKYQMYADFKKAIGYREESNAEDYYVRQYENFERLCWLVLEEVRKDSELLRMQQELVDSEPRAYADYAHHLLVQTVIYVYKRARGKTNLEEKTIYWPPEEEYMVSLSKDEWIKYIKEIEQPYYPTSMAMLKALLELGGEASCKKLSEVYGGHPSRYVSIAANIGKRAKKYFGLSACMDGEVERFFPIPFWGREVSVEGTKYYSYKLREPLQQALEEIDLTDVNPYFEEDSDVEPDTKVYEKYTKTDFLSEVFMQEKDYDTLVSLIRNKKNIILQGAPGVGKTFAAKRLAYSLMGEKNEGRIQFVQFHQNYSYEDFVMGYRPNESGFELKYGIFYQFCKTAEKHPEDDYFFIIDEINRGNLSKIFGELLMLIEKDYRGDKTTLAYDGALFSVPKNLFIIGMMNTADRSLAMIDYALRRRFSFYTMNPGFESDGFAEYQKGFSNLKLDRLVHEVIELNKAIKDDKSLGAGFCIGHSYFCGHTSDEDDSWLGEIVDYDIIPTLNEYWFDDAEKVEKWSDNLKGAINGQ